MNNDFAIVTALFNIGRGEMESNFKRPFSHYLECFERLLKVNYPMVIYIEPENEHIIWKHRSRENTRVIFKSLNDIKNFPFYDKVQQIRNNPKWYGQSGWLKDSTQGSLDLYNPLVMSKTFLLNDAVLMYERDFGNNWIWLDAGISNTIGNPVEWIDDNFSQKIINHIDNKMLFIAFPYDSSTTEVHGFSREGMTRYAGKTTEYVCRGGLFGGTSDAIHEFNNEYYQLLHQSLNEGLMGTEESIFTIYSYKHPSKCNIKFIEGNGLIIKYLNDLKAMPIEKRSEYPLAFYSMTYNTPKQFKIWIDSFIKAYPDEFKNNKKYVIDNSTDENAIKEYKKLFEEYNFEVIHEGSNIGIQDGRQKAAEHFDKSDHKYYIFFEEDMNLVNKNDVNNKDGFIRYVPDLFNKAIDIFEKNKLDMLRLTIIEFYGRATEDWAFKNVPEDKRKIYFPEREDGNEELRWKAKVDYLGVHKDLSYAVGQFHYSNWPQLMNKKGNKQLFLSDVYVHLYEQVICSLAKNYMMEGKLKVGTLLAAPIEHNRIIHYKGSTRRENRHYTN